MSGRRQHAQAREGGLPTAWQLHVSHVCVHTLKEQSGGKLGVKVFASGALGAERDTIEQLKIGGLDMMRINAAPLNNIVPETIAISMPFVFRSVEHMRNVLDGPIGDEILAAMAAQGMVGLAFYDSGARSIYTAKKPSRRWPTSRA